MTRSRWVLFGACLLLAVLFFVALARVREVRHLHGLIRFIPVAGEVEPAPAPARLATAP